MRIIIESSRVYCEENQTQVDLQGVSSYIYTYSENAELKEFRFINHLRLSHYLDHIKSIQELVVEENKSLLLYAIGRIKEKQLQAKEVVIKDVPCISKSFKEDLEKLNIKVISQDFIQVEPREQLAFYNLGVEKLIKQLWEAHNEQLKRVTLSEERRIKFYIQRMTPYIIATMKKGINVELPLKVMNTEGELEEIVLNIKGKELAKVLIDFDKKLSINERYRLKEKYKVVLISPFSYGKSTLINALLGKELLNADVRAETANITKIIWDEQRSVLLEEVTGGKVTHKELTYSDEDTLFATLQGLTSVREDGNSLNQISILGDYGIDKEITFIDSPGLFSRYEHHDQLSKKALLQGDMVIFIISPEQVGDSNFTEIIKAYREYLMTYKKDVCFVLTKKDMYEEEECEKALRETQIVLSEMGFEGVDVFFVSAYIGLKAKLYEQGLISLDNLRKDRIVFLEEDGDLIRGRYLEEKHIPALITYSNIDALRERIIASKEKYSQGCRL